MIISNIILQTSITYTWNKISYCFSYIRVHVYRLVVSHDYPGGVVSKFDRGKSCSILDPDDLFNIETVTPWGQSSFIARKTCICKEANEFRCFNVYKIHMYLIKITHQLKDRKKYINTYDTNTLCVYTNNLFNVNCNYLIFKTTK